MMEKILNGDQALAYGAVEADVRVVTGYPGSPGTKVLTNILEIYKDDNQRHIEWSVNEKVAFEMALGASLGGDRSLLCLKSVGMNITVDPIMTANLTGVNAGLVIMLGDDPGAWLSQNEQDTRLLVEFLELPIIEPANPQEGKDMMVSAFEMSEEFQTIVVIREVRGYSMAKGPVKLVEHVEQPSKGFIREKNRWISTTFNVLENHRKLHEKLNKISQRFENSQFNSITGKNSRHCIIAAGFTYSKLLDTGLDDFSVLKLGTINPVPPDLVAGFLKDAETVLVLEDNEPYIENKVKAIVHDAGLNARVVGKTTGHIYRVGEITQESICQAVDLAFKGGTQTTGSISQTQVSEKTQKTFCEGCPFTPTFEVLSRVIKELGENPVIIAEPGCGVKLNAPPFEMLDVKYSLGSAIGIASGLAKTRAKIKPIAVCGDSSFFHTGVNALMNAVTNGTDIFIMVLDNAVTAFTGYQTHPGTGRDIRGNRNVALDIDEIARACQVPYVSVVNPDDQEMMWQEFRKAMTSDELSLVVVRKPCPEPVLN
jgi:indolepyruvate ferredoxin oxidoreductase alpha subunit